MKKKILFSLLAIAAAAAVVIGGTTAFFSDTETSTGNTFTAGAIDLKVDSQAHYNNMVCVDNTWQPEAGFNYVTGHYPAQGSACGTTWGQNVPGVDITNEKFFDFEDLKPGDQGENTISLHVINNPARACVVFDNMANNENLITEPESSVDVTANVGELAQELNFFAWADDGDNIWESGEQTLFSNVYGPASDVLDGKSYDLGILPASDTKYIGLYWCYGTLTVGANTLDCSGASVTNASQSDSLTGDVWFYVEQERNNPDFACPTPNSTKIGANDLETDSKTAAKANDKWFFYDDNTDLVMTLNQFSGQSGVNDIVAFPGSNGSAQMTLDTNTTPLPRYNIATYRYNDVKLSDIGSLKYRIYDASASAETPYLHFNIDFANNDTWQKRLVQVPTGVSANTWTTVDALAGTWTLSGGNWPAGGSESGSNSGLIPKIWASIIADYPNAETRSTDSFFGVRVGHPGPIGETGYVDWIDFDGEISDFGN